MKNLFHRIRLYLSNIGEAGSISLENIGFAVTATILVSAIVVTSGGGVVNDTEEKAHFLNAAALVSAVEMIAKDIRLPAGSEPATFTLASLQEDGKIDMAIDPSTEDAYDGVNTSVTVTSERNPLYANPVYSFDVKLTSSEGWIYLDTEKGPDVFIPARHDFDASAQF